MVKYNIILFWSHALFQIQIVNWDQVTCYFYTWFILNLMLEPLIAGAVPCWLSNPSLLQSCVHHLVSPNHDCGSSLPRTDRDHRKATAKTRPRVTKEKPWAGGLRLKGKWRKGIQGEEKGESRTLPWHPRATADLVHQASPPHWITNLKQKIVLLKNRSWSGKEKTKAWQQKQSLSVSDCVSELWDAIYCLDIVYSR